MLTFAKNQAYPKVGFLFKTSSDMSEYYPLPNKRTGTTGKKLLRSGGGLAWVRSKKLSEILVGTFIRVGTFLNNSLKLKEV